MLISHNILFFLSIGLYYFNPNPFSKMIPALFLTTYPVNLNPKISRIAFFLAALGDYFLAIPGINNLIYGIMCFSATHSIFVYLAYTTGKLFSHATKKIYIFLYLVLSGIGHFISSLVPSHVQYYILGYTQNLIWSLLTAIFLYQSYRISEEWIAHSQNIHNPKKYLGGIILFIISDLFVLGDILNIPVPPIGLILYWLSLWLIAKSIHN